MKPIAFVKLIFLLSFSFVFCGNTRANNIEEDNTDSLHNSLNNKNETCDSCCNSESKENTEFYLMQLDCKIKSKCIVNINKDGSINVDSTFVPPVLERVGLKDNHNDFISIDTIELKLCNDNYSIELLMGKKTSSYGKKEEYEGYYEENMFIYDRIKFYRNGKPIASYQNHTTEGWEGFKSRFDISEWNEIKKTDTNRVSKICKTLALNDKVNLLLFRGAFFPSSVPSLTIFLIKGDAVIPVYHKTTVVNDIKEQNGELNLDCVTSYAEIYMENDEEKVNFGGFYFNIYTKDANLYYKKKTDNCLDPWDSSK